MRLMNRSSEYISIWKQVSLGEKKIEEIEKSKFQENIEKLLYPHLPRAWFTMIEKNSGVEFLFNAFQAYSSIWILCFFTPFGS